MRTDACSGPKYVGTSNKNLKMLLQALDAQGRELAHLVTPAFQVMLAGPETAGPAHS